jgi:hypothetical protein
MTFRTKVNCRKGVFRFLGSNIYLVIGTGLVFGVWCLGFVVWGLEVWCLLFVVCCLLEFSTLRSLLLCELCAKPNHKQQTTNFFPAKRIKRLNY